MLDDHDLEELLTNIGYALVSRNEYTYVLIAIEDVGDTDIDVNMAFEIPASFFEAFLTHAYGLPR